FICVSLTFCLYFSIVLLALRSFPTRRSSDLFRKATGLSASRAQDWYPYVRAACIEFEITAPTRLAAFLAQVGHESGGFVYTREIDRKSTRLNSSHVKISYAVFCLKKKKSNCDAGSAPCRRAGTAAATGSTACIHVLHVRP